MSKSKQSNLEKLRKENNLSQEDVANIIGCTRKTYALYENGTKLPTMPLLIALSDYFKVSTDYILGRSNCRSVTNDYVNKKMGLSDEAINEVKSLDQNSKMLLNLLLASSAAKDMLIGLYPFICTIPQDEIKIHDMTSGKENTFNFGLETLKQYAIRTYTQAIEKLYHVFDNYRTAKQDAYISDMELEIAKLKLKQAKIKNKKPLPGKKRDTNKK